MNISLLVLLICSFTTNRNECLAWSSSSSSGTMVRSWLECCNPTMRTCCNTSNNNKSIQSDDQSSRRSFLFRSLLSGSGTIGIIASYSSVAAGADIIGTGSNLPMVTVAEFETILKSSAKSIKIVELFSYSPSDQRAIVTLVDGSTFGLSNLMVDSPTDPRSPLKLASTLQRYNVPYRFPLIEEAVSKYSQTSKKRKLYLNEGEREAMKKQEAKRERMAKDEEEAKSNSNSNQ